MATAEPRVAADDWTTLQVKRTFLASRERVFEAWTDPELLKQWLTGPRGQGLDAQVDPRVGGEFRVKVTSRVGRMFGWLPGPSDGSVQMVGRYLEITPPERLVFTFGWEELPTVHLEPDATMVTVEFHERGDGTELVLTHERQPNRRVRAWHSYGWRGSLRKLSGILN